jgi:5-methylcytosine-specific restriction endonuclease McrA
MTRIYRHPDPEASMGRCSYCDVLCYPRTSKKGVKDPFCVGTRDHVLPKSLLKEAGIPKFGPEVELVLACNACNQIKGSAPPEAFRAWRKDFRDPGVSENKRQFNVFIFGLTEIGWRKVRDDAAWGPPARTIAELVRKVAR